jgi:hypothetical protein
MSSGAAQLLEGEFKDAQGALECYEHAEKLPQGQHELKILAPLGRLQHLHAKDAWLAHSTYAKSLIVCADALLGRCRILHSNGTPLQLT